ncbi:MAG: 23S rRNA pseudouridine2457 synthase [Candidatus Azotimanducaceae bacterium]|jgi:23S rRNA pseudouridine2457 synthase
MSNNLLLFNKPFNVVSQFSEMESKSTLKDYINLPGYYPAGRLDQDSEGLLALTNDGALQARISHPKYKLPKTYWVQVEGIITEDALARLASGVELNDGKTKPALVNAINEPDFPARNPPVRIRVNIPTSWVEITIKEGRNRQVRRMTANVGFPTLRLIRAKIGDWELGEVKPGEYQLHQVNLPEPKIKKSKITNRRVKRVR